jgi:hypothetical protein
VRADRTASLQRHEVRLRVAFADTGVVRGEAVSPDPIYRVVGFQGSHHCLRTRLLNVGALGMMMIALARRCR